MDFLHPKLVAEKVQAFLDVADAHHRMQIAQRHVTTSFCRIQDIARAKSVRTLRRNMPPRKRIGQASWPL
jgi:hypothetical protein